MTTKAILSLSCILMLWAGVVCLATLDRKELEAYRASQARSSQTPYIGSLVGINARGEKEKAEITGNGHLLVFVIHHEQAASEVQFWNRVIYLLNENRQVPAASIQYWGICDTGGLCNSYQRDANFTILGYLDPFEMHIVAGAEEKNEALLYEKYKALTAPIARSADAASEANLVAEGVKSE